MFALRQSDFEPSLGSDNFLHGMDDHLDVRHMSDGERLAHYDEKEAEVRHATDMLMDGATIAGTAGAFGWWSGRYGMPAPFGIPADLIAAGLGYGIIAFQGSLGLGSLGKYEKTFVNVAHGAFAHYLTYVGTRFGRSMRSKAGEGPLTNDQENPPTNIGGGSTSGWSFFGLGGGKKHGQLGQGAPSLPFGQTQQVQHVSL